MLKSCTEDNNFGPVQWWVPNNVDSNDPLEILYGSSETTFLLLKPGSEKGSRTYEWISDIDAACINANTYFPKAKGLDCFENLLYFTSKKLYMIHVLNLDDGTYTNYYTCHVFFMGS